MPIPKLIWRSWVVGVCAVLGLNACGLPSLWGKEPRPNFLIVVVDDQSPFDLRPYHPQSKLETPTLERLARNGMVIDGAYHMGSFVGAVCTPSRHMMMCGRTLWHLPIAPKAKEKGLCPDQLELQTLAAVFNRAGYATMRTCKLGNSYEGANRQFTVRRDAKKNGDTDETGSAWHANQVLEYLAEREQASEKKPFLIHFGFTHPHDPRNGKAELLAKYGAVNHREPKTVPILSAKAPPLPINYLPAHPFPHGHPNLRDEVNVEGVWERRDEATIRNEVGRYFACSENIDLQIDRVLQKLEAMGELDNTYVLYTSDHGIALGRHGLQGKQNLYEHTWRVPFIIQGPGIQPGSRAQGNVYLLDLLATLCDLAGIVAPESNEGLSLRPVLMGQKQTIRDVLYGVYCGGTKPGMRCVRKGDWKLIQYDVMESQVRETQLFHLASNPLEIVADHHSPALQTMVGTEWNEEHKNLASMPEHADKRRELESLLLQEMIRLDDPHRLWYQPSTP